jgi:hypothetical protein
MLTGRMVVGRMMPVNWRVGIPSGVRAVVVVENKACRR